MNEQDIQSADGRVPCFQEGSLGGKSSRRQRRKSDGRLRWIHEHKKITALYGFDRVPLPDKGEHVGKRGRKAAGQSWSLIAGLPKELVRGQRLCQNISGTLT